ncbi:hypothetical protein [Pseudofrankia asymbiotica]|uniref:Uncharacterized protein n=1 Tax=Pseudofrankia asymbiotica TaxID=1834516 RepID=A0A1V2I204_9ACTN|nr:hypothetical protein [Pseudofrankia asymbiotica]ONH23952.1 hypothetical protein BL253_31605 [Pseudofrankia asymbiotica]
MTTRSISTNGQTTTGRPASTSPRRRTAPISTTAPTGKAGPPSRASTTGKTGGSAPASTTGRTGKTGPASTTSKTSRTGPASTTSKTSRTGPASTTSKTGGTGPAGRASTTGRTGPASRAKGNGKAGPASGSGRPSRTGSARLAGPVSSRGRADAVAVRFTETMRGFFTFDETDPRRGYEQGRADGTRLLFRLTIGTDDVDAFVADPRHQAVANGHVDCDALGGPRPVADGEFNLFVADGGGASDGGGAGAPRGSRKRRMIYRLPFADAAGHPLTLRGHKLIQDDGVVHLWRDTTTLYTRVYAGHVGLGPGVDPLAEPDARVVGAGILVIPPLDFLRQLTTFRTDPAGLDGLAGLTRFAKFFLGELWRVYVPSPGRPAPGDTPPEGSTPPDAVPSPAASRRAGHPHPVRA